VIKNIDLNIKISNRNWRYIRMKYRILIEQDEDGVFVAECPALPGCISQGKTREEALGNIQDAVKGYLESLEKHNEPIPPAIMEEIVEVAKG
jgi:predicted RNase H-like HicB family nuclease